MNKPVVSVCMITYNHERFIAQAIKGVLMQETNYPIEVIIANDGSTDNTFHIISELAVNTESKFFKIINNKENIGMVSNFSLALNSCKGKYIAICEGDDYWTDPLKIQKQIDFLETRPDFTVSFTNCKTVNEKGETLNTNFLGNKPKAVLTKYDLPIIAPTLTRVFRNEHLQEMQLPNITALDAYLLIWQAQFGKIGYIDEVTAAYRKHGSGIWSLKNKIEKGRYYVELRLAAFDIIGKELYPQFYRSTLMAILKLKKVDGKSANCFLSEFKKTYSQHELNFKSRLLLDICVGLVQNNYTGTNNTIKKVVNRLLSNQFKK